MPQHYLPPALSWMDRVQVYFLRLLCRSPRWLRRVVAGPPIRRAEQVMDLDNQVMLRLAQFKRSVMPGRSLPIVQSNRLSMLRSARLAGGVLPAMHSIQSAQWTAPDGYPVPLRIYTPNSDARAVLIFLHGGGWVQGDLDTHASLCQQLAHHSGMTVLAVNYRKAPEHLWPAALEDAWGVYCALQDAPEQWGLTPASHIAVAGDSAGGNLAAILAQRAARAGRALHAQLLLYPVIDSAREHSSRTVFADGLLLTREIMADFEALYLPPNATRNQSDISPLYGDISPSIAPTILVTAGMDPLRDEGRAYVQHLQKNGARALHIEYAGYVHGFMNFGTTTSAQTAIQSLGLKLAGLVSH